MNAARLAMPVVTIRFATNRNYTGGTRIFGDDIADRQNPSNYRTGRVDFALTAPTLPDNGWSMVDGSLVLDPPKGPDSLAGRSEDDEPDGILGFLSDLMSAPKADDFGLVLLPGFASTFISAMQRAAQVGSEYGAAQVFCFSWPANGIVSEEHYRLDQKDAADSGPSIAYELARLLAETRKLRPAELPPLEIVAHSMGNYALRYAVQSIAAEIPKILKQKTFRGALLMCADEDLDTLSRVRKLAPFVPLANRITVYTAGNDRALMLSSVVNGFGRLGLFGPSDMPGLNRKVTWVEAGAHSKTRGDFGEDHHRHQYYRLAKAVIADVRHVLAGTPPQRIPHRLRGSVERQWVIPFYRP